MSLVIRATDSAVDSSDAPDLDFGPIWTGSQEQLQSVWDGATRQVSIMFRAARRAVLPRQNRLYRFDYMRWIWPCTAYGKTHVSVGVASEFTRIWEWTSRCG